MGGCNSFVNRDQTPNSLFQICIEVCVAVSKIYLTSNIDNSFIVYAYVHDIDDEI